VARVEDKRSAYRVLVRRSEGKRPLERHRHRWEDTIKMGLNQLEWLDRTGLIWLSIGTGSGLLLMR
jgi:hypothetical protein